MTPGWMLDDTRPLVEAALWYAEHGFPVFPLHSAMNGLCSCLDPACTDQGKHPRTRHGFKNATTDRAKILSWWKKWPDANIGIPTGSVSRLLVLDRDPRNGGPRYRYELVDQVGPIPETAEVITGGDGGHVYLRYAGGRVPQKLGPGIDLKGDGGYVVAPPSLHLSGKRYEWDGIEGENALLKLGEAPQWLIDRIAAGTAPTGVPHPASRTRKASRGGKTLRPGERNNGLTSVAGGLRRRGMTREEMETELLSVNQTRCDPPLDPDEVRRIAASIARYPVGLAKAKGNQEAFLPPGYKHAHEVLWDVVRFAADLPGFPVLFFHIERSLFYGKAQDCTSISQMVSGVMALDGKSWIRRGCGLKKAAIVRANKALADSQLLHVRRRSNPELGFEPTEYEVNWKVLRRHIDERKQGVTLVSKRYKPLVSKRDTHNKYQQCRLKRGTPDYSTSRPSPIIRLRKGHEGAGLNRPSICPRGWYRERATGVVVRPGTPSVTWR